MNELLQAARLLADAAALLARAVAAGGIAAPGEDTTMLTVRQLGARLHRSPSTVRAWVERGEFAGAVKVGRGWLVPAVAVTAFLDGQRRDSPRQDQPGGTIPPTPNPRPHPARARDGGAPDLSAWREVRESRPGG